MSKRIRDMIERLKTFEAGRMRAIERGLNDGLNLALRDAVTVFMEPARSGIASGPFSGNELRIGEDTFDPPNPPPGPLKIRTGNLRRGVYKFVRLGPEGVKAGLGSKSEYGKIHEVGGVTSPHLITPVKAKMLRFLGSDGRLVFANRVNHPGSKIPPRPYLKPALEKNAAYIVEQVRSRLIRLLRGEI